MTLITCPRCGRQVAGGRFCPGCGSRLDDPLAGKLLGGKWRLASQSSSGPFFATYRAEPKSGGGAVAVKVLDAGMAEDDGRRRRFLENAGAALALTDRRVLAVREMAEEPIDGADGKPRRAVFAVADAPVGPSLADVVRKQGAMDPARAAARVRGILDALAAVHASGVVHGDLHPACVFLEPDGAGGESVRLADAGLGRGLGPTLLAEGTDPAALGSDGGRWIAPEQASGQTASLAADLHAAGAILYYALTGGPPWQAEKGQALLFEIQRSFPRPVSEVRPRAPQGLDAVVDRALAKSPAERFGSAAEFSKALAAAVSGLPAAPGPELPDDVTPGAVSLDGTATGASSPGDATIAAPRASLAAPPADSAVHTANPVETGDETIIGTRAPGAPPAAPPRRPGNPAPTAVARPSSPGRQSGGAAAKTPAPPAKSRSSSARSAAAPPPGAPEETVVAAPPPTGKAGKPRGPWTVGTPVTIFAIVGFLGVGALYGFVWAGRLDWDIPPWLRALTGRDAIPHLGEGVRIAPQAVFRAQLNVELPVGIRRPMSGEGKDAIYGSWRLVRDPLDAAAAPDAAEAPAPAPAEKVFAMGEFRGQPTESGVLPLDLRLPPGKYRLHGTFRFGEIDRNLFEMKDEVKTVPFKVRPGPTRLVVRTRPEVAKTVTVERLGLPSLEKQTERGIAEAVFGLPESGDAGRLHFGDECTVRVEAKGYGKFEERITLDADPHVKEVELVEDRRDKVQQAKRELETIERLSPTYENDPAVLGAPEILALLAQIAAKNGAFAKVESYLENLQAALKGSPFPPEAAAAYRAFHEYLHAQASEAARRGDVANVREARARTRPEVLEAGEAKAERARWAVLEVQAWRGFPPSAAGTPEGTKAEWEPVVRMVEEDLKLLPDEVRDRMRKEVALQILEHRAWPAWRGGNDLRPARKDETPPVPGPEIRAWLDLARKACPEADRDPAFQVSFQRLAARLEDLENHPERVVFQLLDAPAYKPGDPVSGPRLDLLARKDHLLLARAFARWGDLRIQAKEPDDAKRLWQSGWEIYANRLGKADPSGDFPEELAAASLLEAARLAGYVRTNEAALEMVDKYLKIRPGDEAARKLKADLAGPRGPAVPQLMQSLKYELVFVDDGPFVVGTDENTRAEERPFRTGGMEVVPVGVLTRREYRVFAFLGGVREVTFAQYKAFLALDGEQMARLRHPDEPPERRAQGARRPVAERELSDAEPVRGVDWWDAWACARFLGGRLPTEAEWEKLARWSGRPQPAPDPIPEWHRALAALWVGLWPSDPLTLGVLDVAPSGAKGIYGGVAEWTMDPFENLAPNARGALVDAKAEVPPRLGSGATLMAVRGGSFYHRAPGEGEGPSPFESNLGASVPPGGREPLVRAADLLERRGIRAEVTAPWLGFRVVVGSPEGEARRPTK